MTTTPKSQTVPQNVESDLHDARTLLSDSRKVDDGEKYRKAAKIILLKILYLDPSHAEARTLLAEATASAGSTAAPAAKPILHAVFTEIPITPPPQMPRRDELQFTTSYAAKPVEKKSPPPASANGSKLPLILTLIAFLAGGWFLIRPHYATTVVQAKTAAPSPSPDSVPATQAFAASEEIALKEDPLPPTTATPVNDTSSAEASPVPAPRVPVTQEPGALAVSSAIAADIYLNEKYIGSTPTTLNLPAGPITLEYRHGSLRAVMTHEIKPKETTTALVAFDTTVQINARPWAQVFVEGSQRRALGQTPLGSVRVPIGSVLTFENPNFAAKSYRISEKDSSIQIVFP